MIVAAEDVLLREEEIDPRVAQPRRHRHGRQTEEGVGDAVGGRVVLQPLAPAIGERDVGGALDAYGGIGLEGLHGGEAREIGSRAAGQPVGSHLGDQRIKEALLIEEEVGDIEEDRLAVAAESRDGELVQRDIGVALPDILDQGRLVGRIIEEVIIHHLHDDDAVFLDEADRDRSAILEARESELGIGDVRYRGGDQHLLTEGLTRELHVELLLLEVKG